MKKLVSISIFILGFQYAAVASSLVANAGEVKFTAIGKPGFLKIHGQSKGDFPKGEIQILNGQASGDFEFNLKNLDTGIELRNEHMKEKYLEIGKFPTAKLKIEPIAVSEEELKSDFSKKFQGQLLLHGVTKGVSGNFDYQAKTKNVVAKFNLKVSDFNIAVPQYLGVTVSENVETEVLVKLKDKE